MNIPLKNEKKKETTRQELKYLVREDQAGTPFFFSYLYPPLKNED